MENFNGVEMDPEDIPSFSWDEIKTLPPSFTAVVKSATTIEHLKAMATGLKKSIAQMDQQGQSTANAVKLLEQIRVRAKAVKEGQADKRHEELTYTPKYDHERNAAGEIIKYAWEVEKSAKDAQRANR